MKELHKAKVPENFTKARSRVTMHARVLGVWLVSSIPLAALGADEPRVPSLDESELTNWITLSAGGVFLNGQVSRFQQRTQLPNEAFGGIEDFHYEIPVKKKGLLLIDARAIADQDDYLLKFDVSHPDVGYFRAGYRSYLNYYDGLGGWFPRNDLILALYDPDMRVKRSEVWTEMQYILPDESTLRFEYRHSERFGRKDSLVWGDSGLVGLGGGATRGLAPSFWDIDEVRDAIVLDFRKSIAKTDFGIGVRFERGRTDNSRNERRRPNEAQDRVVTQKEEVESHLFSTHTFTESRILENLMITTGFSYTTLDTDLAGSRIYGAGYDPVYDPTFARRQQRDEGFFGLGGGSRLHQYVGNISGLYQPCDTVSIVPAVRVESLKQDGVAEFTETNVGAPPGLPPIQEPLTNLRHRGLLDVEESLEARFTGIKQWVFFARGELLQGSGDLNEDERDAATGVSSLMRTTESERWTQKYTAGSTWYAHPKFQVSFQYYHKVRANQYDHELDTTSNLDASADRYPAYLRGQDFTTDDLNVRGTWRPFNRLTLVARYDYQWSTVDTEAGVLGGVESARMRSHILSGSATWSPVPRWYLQSGVNYVIDRTRTPANNMEGAALSLVLPTVNNYWNGNLSTGVVLDDRTDLHVEYAYYQADNFVDHSLQSMPYGVEAREHVVTATLSRRFTAAIRASLKYGYFNNDERTSGGRRDYEAHLVMTSVQYRF